jgi:hypothetical protein
LAGYTMFVIWPHDKRTKFLRPKPMENFGHEWPFALAMANVRLRITK